ncbi:hypothetical protein CEXT_132231 [Caerostris extrusa]|uniref:DDE-1 domain-containing protein n=1 Tax=Caerostris extrusa TaxID=172846 RepID=A0AAV4Y8J2_CAEEX|nr:hypothetical protein CEXT_132231 [Caerostris extrusa]
MTGQLSASRYLLKRKKNVNLTIMLDNGNSHYTLIITHTMCWSLSPEEEDRRPGNNWIIDPFSENIEDSSLTGITKIHHGSFIQRQFGILF